MFEAKIPGCQVEIEICSDPIWPRSGSLVRQIVLTTSSIELIDRPGAEVICTRTAVIVPWNVASDQDRSPSLVASQDRCV